jgi:phenylpropionate dioxygenase-like ring-hydroxylating dioxygenase large terminal subunit
MENMLDWPHLPFVHTGTIGRDMAKAMTPTTRLDIDIETTPLGLTSTIAIDGTVQPGSLEFCKPNMMVLHIIDTPERQFCMHVAVVPVDDVTTRMVVVNTRSFLTPSVFNPLFALSNRKIVGEDRAVLESSFPSEAPPPGNELSVRTDKLTLLFRKYWFDELRGPTAPQALPILQGIEGSGGRGSLPHGSSLPSLVRGSSCHLGFLLGAVVVDQRRRRRWC